MLSVPEEKMGASTPGVEGGGGGLVAGGVGVAVVFGAVSAGGRVL